MFVYSSQTQLCYHDSKLDYRLNQDICYYKILITGGNESSICGLRTMLNYPFIDLMDRCASSTCEKFRNVSQKIFSVFLVLSRAKKYIYIYIPIFSLMESWLTFSSLYQSVPLHSPDQDGYHKLPPYFTTDLSISNGTSWDMNLCQNINGIMLTM